MFVCVCIHFRNIYIIKYIIKNIYRETEYISQGSPNEHYDTETQSIPSA